MVKLGLMLSGEDMALKDMTHLGKVAEDAGFDSVWVPEFWRSPFVALTAIAQTTTTVRLSPCVAMAFNRSPFLHARIAADLDEISGGRYILGLGTGTLRVPLGWPVEKMPKPVPGLREYVEVLREIWDNWHRRAGVPVEHHGANYLVEVPEYMASFDMARPTIPIYLGGVQPLSLQLVGEVGDGLVSYPMISNRYLRDEVIPNIAKGATKSGRDPSAVEIVGMMPVSVSDDRERARALGRRAIAFYASNPVYRPLLGRDGFDDEAQRIGEAADKGDSAAMAAAVSDKMLDAFTLSGTAAECRQLLAERDGLLDTAILMPCYDGVPKQERPSLYRNVVSTFSQ